VRQNACEELTFNQQLFTAVDLLRFLANRDSMTVNNSWTLAVDFHSGQSLTDEDVNDAVKSEQKCADLSVRGGQNSWLTSSSAFSNEHHPTATRDQSTQVNYSLLTGCVAFHCIPTFRS